MCDTSIPRIVVSGLRGGSGKTVLSLSLLAALNKRGIATRAFKKGPDYIDAGWLAKASGSPCYNLDLFMMTADQACASFVVHSGTAEYALIEGNRGLYDGMDHRGTYSTAELAKLLKAPVLISIDCTKTTNTIAAMILGCQKMDPDVQIGGVVLNRVATQRQEAVIRKAIEETCRVPVLGAIPRMKKDPFPERHMGLTPFQEHKETGDSLDAVLQIGERCLDLEGILEVSRGAGKLKASAIQEQSAVSISRQQDKPSPPRIGVIRDSAFQFYYEENFEELEKRGAALVAVSPLSRDGLPDIDALYIGGGFPETHAIALAENSRFKASLSDAIEKGLPVYAECGGLMYLGRSLALDRQTFPMVDVFPITFGLQKRPSAHGYTIVEVSGANPYFAEKSVLRGHEFHYSTVLDIEGPDPVMAFNVTRGRGIVDNKDGICYKNVLAAYTHLHAIGSPQWAEGMVKAATNYKTQKEK